MAVSIGILLLSACSWSERPPAATRGELSVVTVTGGADEHDYVYKVRYIVFDNASSNPKLDINQWVDVEQQHQGATEFRSTLNVSSNPDKMLIVVVNEPDGLSTMLDRITSPEGFEDVIFQMAASFNVNHTAPSASGIPMSGVKRGIVVEEGKTAIVEMTTERAVARVELWLKKDDALTSAEVNTSTSVFLSNSHTEGYMITGTKMDGTRFQTGVGEVNNFGHMLTVPFPITDRAWSYINSTPTKLTDKLQLVCAFYVPERTCSAESDTDKLVMDIFNVATSEGDRSASNHILKSFSPEGGSEGEITELLRNNVYQVYGTVKSRSVEFEHTVYRWDDAPQGIILDPQYYLRVSGDNLCLAGLNDAVTVLVETNYDRSDRGFPKGINAAYIEINYFDRYGNLMGSSNGNLYGWVAISMTGADGDLSRNITFTAIKSPDAATGYYAIADITVANITKKIKVTRI